MKQELPGQSHNPSEEETMSVIRSVLTEAEEPDANRKASRAERKAAARANASSETNTGSKVRAFVERTIQPNPRRRAADLPELNAAEETAPKRATRMPKVGAALGGGMAPLIARLRGFRPTTRQIAFLSLALLVVLRPFWFVVVGVSLLVVVAGSFMIFGSDRVWGVVLALLDRVEAISPKRADRLRDRLDDFACRWDSFLDRFPEDYVEAFYMPDLQAMKEADDAYHAALDSRIDRMAQDG